MTRSSGVQILPAILNNVDSVVNFIREPTWISPFQIPGFEAKSFTEEQKIQFKKQPESHLEYRKAIERPANGFFPLFLADSDAQKQAFEHFQQGMKSAIPDPDLQDKLTPQWNVGCRRLTPGVGYLDSLADSKSSVVYGEISRINPKGPVTEDGREHAVDVLICATGFDTTFKPRFPLIGLNGIDLAKKWRHEPSAYLGVAAAGFPNYFMFLGPNCPVGNGPVLIGIEAQADYMMKFVKKLREENIR